MPIPAARASEILSIALQVAPIIFQALPDSGLHRGGPVY
jgi:hypothetical protein